MDQRQRAFVGPIAVGPGGAVVGDRVVAVARADSAPVRRALSYAEEHGLLIDLTYGRQAQAVVFLDSGHAVRVALEPEEFAARWRDAVSGERSPTAGSKLCSS